jgi:hypothetical protein
MTLLPPSSPAFDGGRVNHHDSPTTSDDAPRSFVVLGPIVQPPTMFTGDVMYQA